MEHALLPHNDQYLLLQRARLNSAWKDPGRGFLKEKAGRSFCAFQYVSLDYSETSVIQEFFIISL